ncbi:hypothetical protein XH80_14605 [Bradyrhizobium sp. CCBAU 45384]|nr:hypothetical protein [Bradyrhizobium sp. CCBAU 45384]
MISAKLSSGDLVDLNVIQLDQIDDLALLEGTAGALEGAVNRGLDIARRLGWDGKGQLWLLGELYRVIYVVPGRRTAEGIEDPDAYHRGIAPSVKLLFAVVSRIASLDRDLARPFVARWRSGASVIHVRLWAAAAKSFDFVSVQDVAEFLNELDDREFWDLHTLPEIAELRATRFHELDAKTQQRIADRLSKGPPRNLWVRKGEPERVKQARLYSTIRELNRIQIAGGALNSRARSLLAANIASFPELRTMPANEGFPDGPVVRDVFPEPDDRFEALEGVARLRALEAALGSSRGSWNDDPAGRADDWLRQPDKTKLVLRDLEAADRGGDEFPKVWECFGWAHSPNSPQQDGTGNHEIQREARRVLALLAQLSETTLRAAIDGVSNWLDHWRAQVVSSPAWHAVWFRAWPLAVIVTNEAGKGDNTADLSASAAINNDRRETMDLDTLNTPAGKLVGVFLAGCPSLNTVQHPFETDEDLRRVRDALVGVDGRSGLIARHRLIEFLSYFLRADHTWTERQLIRPLLNDDAASLALWRAIARRTHFADTLAIIGGAMAQRACDKRLGRETRGRLAFSVVVESLHAFRKQRPPAVPNGRITQMLRTLEDEVRAAAANAIQQFIRDVSENQNDDGEGSAADLFRSAASPFIRTVWPQERSLTTPGVSKAFADLPATSRSAFAEAVGVIERFLVPFECWSMLDYGLYGDEGGDRKLAMIDDAAKGEALLRLLDLTVGASEGAVIPYDLTDALDQISNVAPQLAERPAFRRLSTAARRN